MNNGKQGSLWALPWGEYPGLWLILLLNESRHQFVDLLSTYFTEISPAQKLSLSTLQMTRGHVGRSDEFPQGRRNKNQILDSAKMRNVSRERKKKEKKHDVFLMYRNVKSLWKVNKDFLGKQE